MSTKVHILNTGQSDCLLIESEGHLLMIDGGEDSDYPKNKPWLNYKGYEHKVISYLIDNFSDEEGKVVIDMIVATHSHSDHIGVIDSVILDSRVKVKSLYTKPYCSDSINLFEKKAWDNKEVYSQMISAALSKKVKILSPEMKPFYLFGSCEISFYNRQVVPTVIGVGRGENTNSIVIRAVDKDSKNSALFMGDLNDRYFYERSIFKLLSWFGTIKVLKVGHHGHFGSTPRKFIKSLSPEISIVCGSKRFSSSIIDKRLRKYSNVVYYTSDFGDIVIDL